MIKQITLLTVLLTVSAVCAEEKNTELKRFQGHWQVTELAEDGKVIPKEAIKEWLPSGGQAEIVENAIIFKSPLDGKKFVKIFSVDGTTYPKRIDVSTQKRKDGWGIYQFDDEKLVICLADPDEAKRPTKFSAETGSKRMLMVLKRRSKDTAAAKPAKPLPKPAQAGKILTDGDVTKMLAGSWRLKDSAGTLFVTFNSSNVE